MRKAMLLAGMVVGVPVFAGTLDYAASDLEAYRQTVAPIVERNFALHVVGSLPSSERAAAGQIDFEFPDIGPNPVAFAASGQTIIVPMSTVRFLDDLFLLQSWFDRHGCSQEAIESYLSAALSSRQSVAPPLEAFVIDRNTAIADPEVNDSANSALSVTVLFMIAHEAGHILLGHQGKVSPEQSRTDELAADDFALDRFAEIGVPPVALALYFSAAVWLEVDPSAPSRSTHPLSGARLEAIAGRFESCPQCFTSSMSDPAATRAALAGLPATLRQLGDLIQSSNFVGRAYILRSTSPEVDFASACLGDRMR